MLVSRDSRQNHVLKYERAARYAFGEHLQTFALRAAKLRCVLAPARLVGFREVRGERERASGKEAIFNHSCDKSEHMFRGILQLNAYFEK